MALSILFSATTMGLGQGQSNRLLTFQFFHIFYSKGIKYQTSSSKWRDCSVCNSDEKPRLAGGRQVRFHELMAQALPIPAILYTGKNPQFPNLVKNCFLLGKSSNSQQNPTLGKIEHSQFHLFLGIWYDQDFFQGKRKLVSTRILY